MSIPPKTTIHPGVYVRAHVIPQGMSVTEAADRLGIGRPAISNFLTGKSALSSGMAARLEKAFGADRKQLLDMQAIYNQEKRKPFERDVAVRPFVPSFLTIKERQIENWADSQIGTRRSPSRSAPQVSAFYRHRVAPRRLSGLR